MRRVLLRVILSACILLVGSLVRPVWAEFEAGADALVKGLDDKRRDHRNSQR